MTKKLYIAGQWQTSADLLTVRSPYDGSSSGEIFAASPDHVTAAIDSAWKARATMKALTAAERGEILDRLSALLADHREEMAQIITAEAGKGIAFSRGEVDRSAETFKFAADEARRLCGELIPFDAAVTGKNRFGYFKRYPIGVIAAITPFNFPLNLVAHKVAPAIAAGCPIILKPASATPLTSHRLVELLLEAGLPADGIQLLVGSGRVVGNALVESDKIHMVTFTGSPAVGLDIRAKAGIKKVTLELGSNSAAIVHEDADVSQAMPRCVIGSFANSGQVCISIQRIYIHQSRYQEFRDTFIAAVKAAQSGDPTDEKTLVGPMINKDEVDRVASWIEAAEKSGATILCGGKRRSETFLEPTILENTDESMDIVSEEAFAPVVSLMSYETIEEVVERVNNSQFGLQAGIFTKDIKTAFYAVDHLEVGGVMVGDMPTFRVDQMPYGGVKLSGTGREGARYSVEEMTELKTVMINLN